MTGLRTRCTTTKNPASVQPLLNPEFTDRSYGSNTVLNPGFDSSDNWVLGDGWAIGSGKATFTPGVNGDMYQTAVTALSRYYRLTYTATNNSYDGTLIILSNASGGSQTIPSTTGSQTVYYSAVGTRLTFRGVGGTTGTLDLDNVNVQQITLDGWTVVGTLGATEWVEYLSDNTVRIYSTGNNMGIQQALPIGTYDYSCVVNSYAAGKIRIGDVTKTDLDVGTNTGSVAITGTTLQLSRKAGGCDGIVENCYLTIVL